MSWMNVLIATTNLPALWPLVTSRNDPITFGAILFASSASFISHLFESHKHGMHGFGCNEKLSYYLNRMDVIAAIILIYRMFEISSWLTLIKFTPIVLFSMVINVISERDKSLATRNFFLITHSIWHISIFIILHFVLKDVYIKC